MTDPVDTVRVVGGRALGGCDAEAVRVAADKAGDAEARLRQGAFAAARAADELAGRAWSRRLGESALSPARWFAAAEEARAVARRLGATADECAVLRDRLLRAAGIYEHGESVVTGAVGGLAGFAGELVGAAAGLPVAIALGAAALSPDSPWAATVVRRVAPWTDEATMVVGALVGAPVAGGLPGSPFAVLRGAGSPVRDGARVLSGLLRAALPETTVTVREVAPTGSGRTWDAAPSDTIEEVLARIPTLTGVGMLDGDDDAGVPTGTLAVQRVVHDDGRVTWTVVIPGTQEYVSTTQPFDGLTDLDLMAHEAADLSVAIEDALDQAGAGSREPVVLVGHSLGGIVAMQLASSPDFRERHPVGAVVTAGSPTASFAVPAGIPVLNIENDEELISNLDGLSGLENPRSADRVTVTRSLAASSSDLDLAAAGSIWAAHGVRSHLRTLTLARQSGSVAVRDVVGRIEAQLAGARTETRFYTARRVASVPRGGAPSGAEPGGDERDAVSGAGRDAVSGASSGRRPR